MKKQLISILVLSFVFAIGAMAQEYKLAKSTGKLDIKEVNHLVIEGYNGNEIVFSSLNYAHERDKRAEGLRAVSSMGLEDNTGIGLSVVEKNGVIEVYQLKKMDGPKVKIMVPKGVSISITHTSPYGSGITFRNVESEIEVSTVHSGITLEGVTGPMTVNTVHGKIEADFNATMKAPISIVSVHGLVDVTLPATVKATMTMSTGYGEIFVDPALKLEIDNQGDWQRYGSNKISGKINGGGIEIRLGSSHGNIYLRKK